MAKKLEWTVIGGGSEAMGRGKRRYRILTRLVTGEIYLSIISGQSGICRAEPRVFTDWQEAADHAQLWEDSRRRSPTADWPVLHLDCDCVTELELYKDREGR